MDFVNDEGGKVFRFESSSYEYVRCNPTPTSKIFRIEYPNCTEFRSTESKIVYFTIFSSFHKL